MLQNENNITVKGDFLVKSGQNSSGLVKTVASPQTWFNPLVLDTCEMITLFEYQQLGYQVNNNLDNVVCKKCDKVLACHPSSVVFGCVM